MSSGSSQLYAYLPPKRPRNTIQRQKPHGGAGLDRGAADMREQYGVFQRQLIRVQMRLVVENI